MNAPKHIAIILDGNRRFAKKLMMQPWKGHEWGAKKFHEFLDWSFEIGITEVTAYAFSIQNFNRPKKEFDEIMKIFTKELIRMNSEKNLTEFKEKDVRVKIVGQLDLLPEKIQQLCYQLMDATKPYGTRKINLCIAYGGREELTDSIKRIAEEVAIGHIKIEEINHKIIQNHLWLNSEPDIIIRTGGEKRLSNFLAWQGTYSELIFVDKFWPDFTKDDLIQCIKDYNSRERRFGK